MKTIIILIAATLSIGCSSPIQPDQVQTASVVSGTDFLELPAICALNNECLKIALENDTSSVMIQVSNYAGQIGCFKCSVNHQIGNNGFFADRADILITEFSDVINCGISFRANDREYTINISDLSVIK
ncbi:MAG: hypothetical protein WC389_10520 [Lutibacter sp.]|jgi:hypothetical protein